MPIKRVKVSVDHAFDLDIPDELLNESNWELDGFIFDAFVDDEDNWDYVDFDIQDIKERN